MTRGKNYVCGVDHIAHLVDIGAALKLRKIDDSGERFNLRESADRRVAFAKLYNTNVEAIDGKGKGQLEPERVKDWPRVDVKYKDPRVAAQCIAYINTYRLQASGAHDWFDSWACAYTEVIRDYLFARLSGPKALEWDYTTPTGAGFHDKPVAL